MLHTKIVDSKDKKLSINDAERFISSVKFGASIFFTGTVRNLNNNKSVIGITYDSHDELVIKSFEEIYKETDEKLNKQIAADANERNILVNVVDKPEICDFIFPSILELSLIHI